GGLAAMRRVMLRLTRGEALLALGGPAAARACTREALAEARRLGYREAVRRAERTAAALDATATASTVPDGAAVAT
ncbi:hypothetical protein ABT160_20370, partial [Streptomyces sp. NPDC001941]|uniref:hypothetical protein n=1 Tax=Streptomyces sp. NPDC001941 TaxID=3154659 RepID=UPI00331E99C0